MELDLQKLSFIFSKNAYKKKENHPDFKGKINHKDSNGPIAEFAVWERKDKNGNVYYTGIFNEPYVNKEDSKIIDDEISF